MKNILLIGAGNWGQKYISIISAISNINLIIANRNNWRSLIDQHPNGTIICTPPQYHIEIAKYSLSNNIPTMIEKPLSLSYIEAMQLSKFTAPILVNHIHLFSDNYQKLKSFFKENHFNKIVSLNFNNGPIREYSSLYDYGCHEIAMIIDLCGMPKQTNLQKIETKIGSLYNIKMQFNNITSESLVGNGGCKRVRKFKIEADGLKITYQDCQTDQPLSNAINIFLNSIDGKQDDRLGLNLSLKVLKILQELSELPLT